MGLMKYNRTKSTKIAVIKGNFRNCFNHFGALLLSISCSLRLRSAMDLPPDKGTGLHEFDALPTAQAKQEFKEKYRNALNSIVVDEETLKAMIEEANYVFKLNRDVCHELEAEIKNSIGDRAFDLLTRQDKVGSTEKAVTNH